MKDYEDPRKQPEMVVTRGDGIPLPDQAAAIEAFKNQCLRPGQDLARVTMPLVRLMNEAQLSWSDREQIASAIQRSIAVHKSMEKERDHLSAAGQQRATRS